MNPTTVRDFNVRPRDLDGHDGRMVVAVSFEAAAIAFVEDWTLTPHADDEVAVIVREAHTGREHCFRIDLGAGSAEPCGADGGA